MRAWRQQHPKATLDEIETELDRQIAALRVEVLGETAGASRAGDGEGTFGTRLGVDCGRPVAHVAIDIDLDVLDHAVARSVVPGETEHVSRIPAVDRVTGGVAHDQWLETTAIARLEEADAFPPSKRPQRGETGYTQVTFLPQIGGVRTTKGAQVRPLCYMPIILQLCDPYLGRFSSQELSPWVAA
jgi:hypothetical protein